MTKRLSLGLLLFVVFTIALSNSFFAAVMADTEQVQQLRATGSCPGCDLRDAELSTVNAKSGDLRNADLRGAILYKADFRLANLTGALLPYANLKGANLSGAVGVNFDGAITDENTKCPNLKNGPCQ